MAEYVDNTTASIVVTIVILTLLSFFYVSNFYIIKLMTKMLDFIQSQQEDNLISQSILRNNHGLYTNQSQADPNNFFVGQDNDQTHSNESSLRLSSYTLNQ